MGFHCSGDHEPSRQPRLLLKPLMQSSGVSLLIDQTRSGTFEVPPYWRVAVEGKSSVNKLAGVFPSQHTTVQEDGAASSTDVAEPVVDSTETYKTANEGASKESVSVEQGQLLRAVEPGKGVLKVKTLRQRVNTFKTYCTRRTQQ